MPCGQAVLAASKGADAVGASDRSCKEYAQVALPASSQRTPAFGAHTNTQDLLPRPCTALSADVMSTLR